MDTTTPSSTSDDATTEDTKGRILSLPSLEKCKTSNSKFYFLIRRIHRYKLNFMLVIPISRLIYIFVFLGPFNFTLNGHGYFYSGWVDEHKSDKVDWLEARNTCREYCMDLVSLETPTEDEMVKEFLTKGNVSVNGCVLLVIHLV